MKAPLIFFIFASVIFCCWSANFYVDPVSGSDSNSGSALDPFKTLAPSFLLASPTDPLTITVINENGPVQVELLRPVTVSSTITVKPSNALYTYAISFESLDVSLLDTVLASAFRINSGHLQITGASFDSSSAIPEIATVFDLRDARLSLENVSIKDHHASAKFVQSLGSTTSLSRFSFINGLHINSTCGFSFVKGLHSLNNVSFIENHVTSSIIRLDQSNITVSNIKIQSGSSLFTESVETSSFIAQNVLATEYSGNFLRAENPNYIMVRSSNFEDLTLANNASPFILVVGDDIPRSLYTYGVINTSFKNIVTASALIVVEKSSSAIQVGGVSMNNISKIEGNYDGVCVVAQEGISVEIIESSFTEIDSNCLLMNSAGLWLTSNVFDNSNLVTSKTQGVTWLTFINGTDLIAPGQWTPITNNQFRNNTLPAIHGGAIQILGTFPGWFAFSSNTFEGNEASQSGGAVYSSNPNQQVKFTNDIFIENEAGVGGALHFVDSTTGTNQAVILNGVQFIRNKSNGPVVNVTPSRIQAQGVIYDNNIEN